MSNKQELLRKTLDILFDLVIELEVLAIENDDWCIDEIIHVKEEIRSLQDAIWKVGVR